MRHLLVRETPWLWLGCFLLIELVKAVGPNTAWVCPNQSMLQVLASGVAVGGHPFGRPAPGGYALSSD